MTGAGFPSPAACLTLLVPLNIVARYPPLGVFGLGQ
jgi:hypothetical protein